MKYEEHLYEICKETDFSNEEEAVETAQILAEEALDHFIMIQALEKHMKKRLTAEQYEDISEAAAKDTFKESIERHPDEEFRDFCKEHMEEILGEEER